MARIATNAAYNSLTTSDDTQTLVTSFDFAQIHDARDISLFYTLVDALGAAISAHLADALVHSGGVDSAAQAMIQESPPEGDLWRYFTYLNSLVTAIIDHATRVDGNVHSTPDNTSFSTLNTLPLATDIESGVALANELKAGLSAHFANITSHTGSTFPVDASDAVDDAYYPGVGQASISVSALDATNHKSRVWKYDAGYKFSDAAVLTLIGIPESTLDLRDSPEADSWDVTVDATGSTLRVRVTGTLTQEIAWFGRLSMPTFFVTP